MTSLFSSRRMFSDMVMQLIVKVMGTVTLFSLFAHDADFMRGRGPCYVAGLIFKCSHLPIRGKPSNFSTHLFTCSK